MISVNFCIKEKHLLNNIRESNLSQSFKFKISLLDFFSTKIITSFWSLNFLIIEKRLRILINIDINLLFI